MSVVAGTAVNAEGKREIVGLDVGTSEDGAFWLSFLRSLVARGLVGVELVISDAHQGLRGAIATLPPEGINLIPESPPEEAQQRDPQIPG